MWHELILGNWPERRHARCPMPHIRIDNEGTGCDFSSLAAARYVSFRFVAFKIQISTRKSCFVAVVVFCISFLLSEGTTVIFFLFSIFCFFFGGRCAWQALSSFKCPTVPAALSCWPTSERQRHVFDFKFLSHPAQAQQPRRSWRRRRDGSASRLKTKRSRTEQRPMVIMQFCLLACFLAVWPAGWLYLIFISHHFYWKGIFWNVLGARFVDGQE